MYLTLISFCITHDGAVKKSTYPQWFRTSKQTVVETGRPCALILRTISIFSADKTDCFSFNIISATKASLYLASAFCSSAETAWTVIVYQHIRCNTVGVLMKPGVVSSL